MKFVSNYKYLFLISGIYLILIIIYWFVFSEALLFSVTNSDRIFLTKIASTFSFIVFIILGVSREIINNKLKDSKIYIILTNVTILVVCIISFILIKKMLGIFSRIYLDFTILSFLYGVFSARVAIEVIKRK